MSQNLEKGILRKNSIFYVKCFKSYSNKIGFITVNFYKNHARGYFTFEYSPVV